MWFRKGSGRIRSGQGLWRVKRKIRLSPVHSLPGPVTLEVRNDIILCVVQERSWDRNRVKDAGGGDTGLRRARLSRAPVIRWGIWVLAVLGQHYWTMSKEGSKKSAGSHMCLQAWESTQSLMKICYLGWMSSLPLTVVYASSWLWSTTAQDLKNQWPGGNIGYRYC